MTLIPSWWSSLIVWSVHQKKEKQKISELNEENKKMKRHTLLFFVSLLLMISCSSCHPLVSGNLSCALTSHSLPWAEERSSRIIFLSFLKSCDNHYKRTWIFAGGETEGWSTRDVKKSLWLQFLPLEDQGKLVPLNPIGWEVTREGGDLSASPGSLAFSGSSCFFVYFVPQDCSFISSLLCLLCCSSQISVPLVSWLLVCLYL